jgi:hypothetical protein
MIPTRCVNQHPPAWEISKRGNKVCTLCIPYYESCNTARTNDAAFSRRTHKGTKNHVRTI